MDRDRILRRIVGPLAYEGGMALRWTFVARRHVRHGMPGYGSDQGRRFTIAYDPKTRDFKVTCVRRLSKKRKREEVTVSKGMAAYLRSRLLPKQLARCVAASIKVQSKPDPDLRLDPVGWTANYGSLSIPHLPKNPLKIGKLGP